MATAKPRITCLPNGPYLLKNDENTPVTLRVMRSGDESAVTGVALCRCGGSKNKPFCDGSHRKNGFSSENLADAAKNRRRSYAGKHISIHDNRAICAHAGECTSGLAAVFRMGQKPWIDPDGADAEAIIAVIAKCPSGALSYTFEDVELRDRADSAVITAVENGPYAVNCEVELSEPTLGEGSPGRYTLCRCGASKNKPFCDGSHWDIKFSDAAD